MASRIRLTVAILALGALGACEPMYGPPPPSRVVTPTDETSFRASDFAWSKAAGHNTVSGAVTFRTGQARYGCAGSPVVLTPETPWSRKRIGVLYQSTERAALPIDEVRGRTSQAPPGDSEPFVRKVTCDSASRFTFTGLPDGAWFIVVPAKPIGGQGPTLALMRRVTTRGGRALTVVL